MAGRISPCWNFGDSSISVLLRKRRRHFLRPQLGPLLATNPVGLVVADFNGGYSKTDVATANSGSPSVTVLLGSPTTVATGRTASGIAAWGGGTHNIDANYPGDTNYSPSASSMAVLAATPIANTVSLSISPSTNLNFGQTVQLTVSISPNSTDNYAAGGTVTLYDGSTVLGTVSLSSGQAVLTTGALSAGSHNLTAAYAGDANFAFRRKHSNRDGNQSGIPDADLERSTSNYLWHRARERHN